MAVAMEMASHGRSHKDVKAFSVWFAVGYYAA